jgi:hypothetical protein
MAVIEVGVVSVEKPNPSCIISLNDLTAPDSTPLWQRLAGGSLPLNAEYGTWVYRAYPNNDILLLIPSQTNYALVLYGVPQDFLGRIHEQSLTGSGRVNDSKLTAITWTMKQLYDKAP